MAKLDIDLKQSLDNLLNSMGFELAGYELIPEGRKKLFRLYIDKPGGVTLDDCAKVSYQVSAWLDVEDPFQGSYTLEVSSPGINRPLFELAHYRQYIGKMVKIKLQAPINERRQYKGVLERVEGEDIYLRAEEQGDIVKLPFALIEKGNIIGEVQFQKSGKH